jgi:lipopolysaccharide biosynthesis glycosyltransferase
MSCQGPIDVALCFDQHLALPAVVAIASILQNAQNRIQFHLVIDPAPNLARLMHAALINFGGTGRIIEAAPEKAIRVHDYSPYGVRSFATYRRLLLADILPDLNRLLYLDADVIVRHDLTELWMTPLENCPLGAVPDAWAADSEAMLLRYPRGYFNSGVLLMDLARWRDNYIGQQAVAAAQTAQAVPDSASLVDQGALNDVLRDDWLRISPRWNFTAYFSDATALALGLSGEDLAVLREEPSLVHFVGGYKPWLADYTRLSRFHSEFTVLRARVEATMDLAGFAWPGRFAIVPADRQRRLLAMSLVHRARLSGKGRWVVVAKGTLAIDVLAVAREQGLDVACVASENPLFHQGRLGGYEVLWLPEAIRCGYEAFLIADYRTAAKTSAYVTNAGIAAGEKLCIVW